MFIRQFQEYKIFSIGWEETLDFNSDYAREIKCILFTTGDALLIIYVPFLFQNLFIRLYCQYLYMDRRS
jgi:hypothetical protein